MHVLHRFGNALAEGGVRADDRGKLCASQAVDDGGGKLRDDIGGSCTHQLGAEDDVGFGVGDDLDEAALLLVDDRAAVGSSGTCLS